jgi:hypothetical protein
MPMRKLCAGETVRLRNPLARRERGVFLMYVLSQGRQCQPQVFTWVHGLTPHGLSVFLPMGSHLPALSVGGQTARIHALVALTGDHCMPRLIHVVCDSL